MKPKHIVIFILPLLLVSFVSCRERPDVPSPAEEAPVVTAETDEIVVYPASTGVPTLLAFRVEGLSGGGRVDVSGGNLKVDFSFDRTSGEGMAAVRGDGGFSGSSTLVVTAADGEEEARVEVHVQEAFIMPSFTTFTFGAEGGPGKVLLYTNLDTVLEADVPWISVGDLTEEGFVFSVGENSGGRRRSGMILVRDRRNVLSAFVSVTQEAPGPETSSRKERAALEAVFRALHGDEWCDSDGWCTDAPLREWYGVMTNSFKGEEHVVYLHLQYLGARGELPSAIGDLRYLKELWIIGDEGITGPIPESLGRLTELRDLTISGTSVSGPIPGCLSSLEKLEILGLDDNLLEGNLPLFLKDLPNLYNFGFSLNCLDGRVDPSLTEARWWSTRDSQTGRTMGEENLLRGQKEGHRLWL